MTRKKAIEILLYMKHDVLADSDEDKALDMAIEALGEKDKKPFNPFEDDIDEGSYWCGFTAGKRAAAQWIPCSERMPEEHEWIGTKEFGTTISDKVNITFDVNGKRFVKVMSLQNGELSGGYKNTMGWKMLAWMPLPDPWEGGGK